MHLAESYQMGSIAEKQAVVNFGVVWNNFGFMIGISYRTIEVYCKECIVPVVAADTRYIIY